ncbi:MAG: hypothetical protein LUD27_06630 [Clostridia bacterium]|nr:hypothetical protein [Clostridia bacterium]
MKKFICTALCSLIALSAVPLASCSNNSGLINLADCEIGYELPVYPDCEFDYKIDDDCVVHISEIKAVLTAKNEINEGDVIEDEFYYRYEISITIEAQLVGEYNSYVGSTRIAAISNGIYGNMYGCATGTIDKDSSIKYAGSILTNLTTITEITFLYF